MGASSPTHGVQSSGAGTNPGRKTLPDDARLCFLPEPDRETLAYRGIGARRAGARRGVLPSRCEAWAGVSCGS